MYKWRYAAEGGVLSRLPSGIGERGKEWIYDE